MPSGTPRTPSGPQGPALAISDTEFEAFRRLVHRETGISLSDQKKALLVGRLSSRLRLRNLATFAEYHRILKDPAEGDELQAAIDLITTNETSFFREADHFQFLRDHLDRMRPVPFPYQVWSAASSSGEEAYTLAMVLADRLGSADWRVVGTDISTRVLERARRGLYPIERSGSIPVSYLKRFCLKGQGKHQGFFLIGRPLRERVRFVHANLCGDLPDLGPFDVAFLRNVLIYFNGEQKQQVVEAVASRVKPGGLLIVGHSESLTGMRTGLAPLRPTVYRVP